MGWNIENHVTKVSYDKPNHSRWYLAHCSWMPVIKICFLSFILFEHQVITLHCTHILMHLYAALWMILIPLLHFSRRIPLETCILTISVFELMQVSQECHWLCQHLYCFKPEFCIGYRLSKVKGEFLKSCTLLNSFFSHFLWVMRFNCTQLRGNGLQQWTIHTFHISLLYSSGLTLIIVLFCLSWEIFLISEEPLK